MPVPGLDPLPPSDPSPDSACPAELSGQGLVPATLALTCALRRAGVPVGLGGAIDALRSAALIGPGRADDLARVLAANLAATHQERELIFRLFGSLFLGQTEPEPESLPLGRDRVESGLGLASGQSRAEESPVSPYSPVEVVSSTDLSKLADHDLDRAVALLSRRLESWLWRRSRRRRPGGRQRMDFRRTIRRSLAVGGEPIRLIRTRPRLRKRRLVLILDVSGSMDIRARFMIAFAKAWLTSRPGRVEVFAFSTRLVRLTGHLADRPLSAGLREIGRLMPEWSGGTRIGQALQTLLTGPHRGLVGSAAAAAVFSDGWDRGDVDLLARQMAALRRRTGRVLWLNPLMGHPAYQPSCAGMTAALPHVDQLIPAHSVDALLEAGRAIDEILE